MWCPRYCALVRPKLHFLGACHQSCIVEFAQHLCEVVDVIVPIVGVDDHIIQIGCNIGAMEPQDDVHQPLECGEHTMEPKG